MKLNITPGPWRYTQPRIEKSAAKLSGETWEKFAKVYVKTKDLSGEWRDEPEGMANVHAIVTAVNNTYHKGINPEAVPEMIENLKEFLQIINRSPAALHHYGELITKVEQTIKKATL